MTKPKPLPVEGLFDRDGQERKVNRLLDKALEKRVRATHKTPRGKVQLKVPRPTRAQKAKLGESLAKAISSQFGAGTKGRASIRQKAPDTNGVPFHFEHYAVTKTGGGPAVSNGKLQPAGGAGTASAHARYIERELAVETLYAGNEQEVGHDKDVEKAVGIEKRPRGRPSRAQLAERAIKEAQREIEGIERTLGENQRGAAAQAYIENPVKLRNGEMVLSSFGNIGDTFAERLRFWELAEEHEPHPGARIQNRLIVELPHQSTAAARLEILKQFTQFFEDRSLPYHAAIHAPGKNNDDRNYHAHIVFTERPAKKMIDPTTNQEEWDFAITGSYKTSSRHTKINHPYRQSRLRELNEKRFIPDLRKSYARIVTDVMKTVDPSVVYDPRSYANMGLDIDPMKTIHRVLHNRMRDGVLVIQDAAWTRRMVEAELALAAQRRDPDVIKLKETVKALEGLREAYPNLKAVNGRLGVMSQMTSLSGFTRKTFSNIIEDRMRYESELVKERVIGKAEIEVCKKVIEATKPLTAKALRKQEPRTPEEAADCALLHQTAEEELSLARARLAAAEKTAKQRMAENRAAFKAAAGKTPATMSQTTYADIWTKTPRAPVVKPAEASVPSPAPPVQKLAPTGERILWEPNYAEEEAERRRKRIEKWAATRAASTQDSERPRRQAPSKQTEPARPPAAELEQPAAKRTVGTQAPAPTLEQAEVAADEQRKRAALKAAGETLIADLNAAMRGMWDQSLSGQALVDSLQVYLAPTTEKTEAAATAQEPAAAAPTERTTATAPTAPGTERQAPAPAPTSGATRASDTPGMTTWDLPNATPRGQGPRLRTRTQSQGTAKPPRVTAPTPDVAPTDRQTSQVAAERPETAAAPSQTTTTAQAPSPAAATPAAQRPRQVGRILEEREMTGTIAPRRPPTPTAAAALPPRAPVAKPVALNTARQEATPPQQIAAPQTQASDRLGVEPAPTVETAATRKTKATPQALAAEAAPGPSKAAETKKKKADRRRAIVSRRVGGRGR